MKDKKGFSLIESLVAVAIFVIAAAAVLSMYMSLETALKRQREYVVFEGICLDIAFYGDRYGKNWDDEYFSGATTYGDGINTLCYYTSSYSPTAEKGEAEYTLSYFYSNSGALILSVNRAGGGSVISSLDYGPARYDEKYLDILSVLSAIKSNPKADDELFSEWAKALFHSSAENEVIDGENYYVYYLDSSLLQTEKSAATYRLYYSYVLENNVKSLYVYVDNISLGYAIIDKEYCGDIIDGGTNG